MLFQREVLGFLPTKVMKTTLVQQRLSLKAPPYPLSSRPKRKEVERSAVKRSFPGNVFSTGGPGLSAHQGDENDSCSATALPESTALPFVISTEAKRSGEICGKAVLSRKCFFKERPPCNKQMLKSIN